VLAGCVSPVDPLSADKPGADANSSLTPCPRRCKVPITPAEWDPGCSFCTYRGCCRVATSPGDALRSVQFRPPSSLVPAVVRRAATGVRPLCALSFRREHTKLAFITLHATSHLGRVCYTVHNRRSDKVNRTGAVDRQLANESILNTLDGHICT